MGILKDRVEIVNQNTKTIKSLGGCADTNSSVSDLLLRIAHYTKKHKKGEEHMFCPECVEGKASIAEKYFFESEQQEFPLDKVGSSHEQVMQDLKEIEMSIDSITFGNLIQMKKLEVMLLKHRDQAKALSRVDFFGGI